MTSLQKIGAVNFNVSPRLALMGRRLSKSNGQSSRITAFLGELFFLFEVALCRRELRAIKRQMERIFKRLGITLRYPMHNLPAQCESIRKEIAPHLLDQLELGVKNYLWAERELEKMKAEAQRARMLLFCRKSNTTTSSGGMIDAL
jgi:hypothetical protein